MEEQFFHGVIEKWHAVRSAAAFRCRTRLQPAGDEGDKVFSATYAGAIYATEKRRLPGRENPVECVLLDSVQSQANRIEEALQDAVDDGRISIPVIEVDFSEIPVVEPGQNAEGLFEPIGRVTSLEAPHRVADAILRDSKDQNGVAFRETPAGKKIGFANLRNATPLFEICPTALLLGLWDSTGPKGGLGTKFQRLHHHPRRADQSLQSISYGGVIVNDEDLRLRHRDVVSLAAATSVVLVHSKSADPDSSAAYDLATCSMTSTKISPATRAEYWPLV